MHRGNTIWRPKQKCHPDRSEAQWRDLLFPRPVTTLNGIVAVPFVIPSVPGFPASQLSPAPLMWFSLKRNHMQLTEAATPDRKSGAADLSRRAVEGSALQRIFMERLFARHHLMSLFRSRRHRF